MTKLRGYLLDTHAVSETRKTRPAGELLHWLRSVEASSLYLSVLTLGELRKGVAMRNREDPVAAAKIGRWVEGLEHSFANRILGVDSGVARIWGEICAERSRPAIDSLLAATAIANDLAFVTRNVRDVGDLRLLVLNPWKKASY